MKYIPRKENMWKEYFLYVSWEADVRIALVYF